MTDALTMGPMDGYGLFNLLVYGMAEVDRNLGLAAGTARRWIDGYERGGKPYDPVVRLHRTGNPIATWGEYVETRLLAEYRSKGVPIIHLRPTVIALRERLGVPYPLAASRTWLRPEGNELVHEVQQETGLDKQLLMVVYRNGQLTMTPPARRFVDAAKWGAEGAERFRTDDDLDVWVDPRRRSGTPLVGNVPTEIVAELVAAGEDPAWVAATYLLEPRLVQDAIRFELRRRPRESQPTAA